MLKDGNSLGVDNIPAEILRHGGPGIIDAPDRRMSENLDQWTMPQRLDKITDYSSSEERQHATLSELQNDQPDLSPQQDRATSDPQQASKPGRRDLGRGTSWFQITEAYHGTDIQLEAIGGKAHGTSGDLS